MPRPPQSEEELLARCRAIAGLTLADLASRLDEPVPDDLRRQKGWVGQLLERTLGATGTSLPQPDFPELGVELKTLPIDGRGIPRESTYVCTVPLEEAGQRWEGCWLRRKLQRVLWLPVEADPQRAMAERRLGMPLLWSPSAEEEAALRRDWEELMDMVCLGELERISARHGEVLQIRPKAANAKALRTAVGPDGEPVLTNPRGFYLRATFTAAILRRHYHLPGS
jgi:DNA mismatch repair protein MutH